MPFQLLGCFVDKKAEPGGFLHWVDPDCSISGWRPISFQPGASTAGLQRGVDTVRRWAVLGRKLDFSNRLSGIFRGQGLEDVQHDVMPVDGEKELRVEFSSEVSRGFSELFVKYARMEGSGMTVEEAVEIGKMMKREADLGEAYLRMNFNIVVGKKPESSPGVGSYSGEYQ